MGELIKYYEDETIRIYLGDGTTDHALFQKADVMITDPPYVISADAGANTERSQLRGLRTLDKVSSAKINNGFNLNILQRIENKIIFCARDQLFDLIADAKQKNWALLTWHKSNPTPLINNVYLPCTEYIVHSWDKGNLFGEYADKFKSKTTTNNRKNSYNHPTVKPLEVMRWLVAVGSDVGQTVIDPFCGSGSTLVACKEMGRKSIGIEIEEKYCEIAANRCRQGILFT